MSLKYEPVSEPLHISVKYLGRMVTARAGNLLPRRRDRDAAYPALMSEYVESHLGTVPQFKNNFLAEM